MSETDIRLLLTALGGVLLLVALIVSRVRLHPLLALLVVSLVVGLFAGMDITQITKVVLDGAGNTLGDVGVIVALGAMLGKILADSNVTETIASSIVQRSSDGALPWAMALAAFVVGIPMFFEVGLVVVLPLVFSVAHKLEIKGTTKGSTYVLLGVPVIAALASMHGMVPPHPGPLTAIATLKTSVAPTMLYGFIAAIPAIVLGGPVYARFIAPKMMVRPDQALLDQFTGSSGHGEASGMPAKAAPGLGMGLLAVLLPAILMLANTFGETLLPKGSFGAKITDFLGEPLVAMLVSVLFASTTLVYMRGGDTEKLREVARCQPQADRRNSSDHRRRRRVQAGPGQGPCRRRHRPSHQSLRTSAFGARLGDRHAAIRRNGIGNRRNCRCRGAVGATRAEQSGSQFAAARAFDRLGIPVLQLC